MAARSVDFRLLGDVEVLIDGGRVDVGHARQRCVLVALLVDVNRPVPADLLIDRVWADQPPHRARNALAGYLSRLRGLLAPASEVCFSREPGGYVLTVDASAVDLHRFRTLVADARAANEPAAALALFDEALGAWRGEPFATLDTPWVNDVRTAVDAERLSATLDRNDAALSAGRHGELLAALAAALRAHPLDERLAGQLMIAQYRSGRQADALETFRQLRERLVDELGADPGHAIRQVHQQLLDGDRQYRPPPVPVVVAASPAPETDRLRGTLPRRVTSFVGRQRDVARVVTALDSTHLVTLGGVGGVGKSRLALEAVSRDRRRVGDGVWLCELAPLDAGAAVSHAVAAALRLQQRHGLDIEGTIIEYLQTRELILIVDNCEHVLDDAARLVDRIVRHCPGVTVLATSRAALGVEGEQILPVDPLGAEDSATLFAARARASLPSFELEQQPVGAVAAICRRLDGLPLAIELAAARMRVMSSLDLARRLDEGVRLLSARTRGALPRHQSVAATVDWSYHLLSEDERALFIRLSVFAGGFDADAAHGVCGADGSDTDDTLELLTGLVDKSMVAVRNAVDRTRYLVLETMRAYGRERLQQEGYGERLARRHAKYYTDLAVRAAAELHGPDERVWVERTLPDYDNLRVAFEQAAHDGDGDLALRLVTSLPELTHLRVGYESAAWALRAVELADPDHPLYPAAVGVAARGAWNRGDFAEARALAGRAAGRVPSRGTGRVAYPGDVLADVALYEGDAATALAHYEAEAVRARGDDDPIRLVWTLFYVAICHAALRVPDTGWDAAEESVRVAERTGNPTARSMAQYALGLVLKKSQPDAALTLFDGAARLAEGVQNFWWHGIALMEAAATRAVHGAPAAAARSLIEVLDHWDRVGDWSQQWLNLRYVTRFLARVGADDDAVQLHRALLAAGRPSPLGEDVTAQSTAPAPTGAEAVVLARASLGRL